MKAYRLRKLQDVVFLGLHTMLVLEIRLFRCVNKDCEKKSFTEPLKVAKPYARMTTAADSRVEYASLNQSARHSVRRDVLTTKHDRIGLMFNV